MENHSDTREDRGLSSLRNQTYVQVGKFGRNMAEGPGLLTAFFPEILTGGNVRRLTSANTPDSLDRLAAPNSQRFDFQFGIKSQPKVKDINFPPGFNGVPTLEGRRRSAEMAVKLNLHTREFPSRQESKPEKKTDTVEEKKADHKAKKTRRTKKAKKNVKTESEKTEISVFLEDRETLTPELYAKGKPAPALPRKGRQNEKRPEVITDAHKHTEESKASTTSTVPSLPPVATTRDEGINQLLAEVDRKSAEYEALRKNDAFFNRFKSDVTDARPSDEEIFGEKKNGTLPPINGNAVSFGKRKTKYKRIVSQTDWNKIERKVIFKDGNAMKLPPISATNTENISQNDKEAFPLEQEMTEKLLTNTDDYWRNAVATKHTASELPPISVAGVSVDKKRNIKKGYLDNTDLSGPYAQDKLGHKLSNSMLPPLTDKYNKRISRIENGSTIGQPLRHISRHGPTLPSILNVKLPPITGLPVQTTTEVKKQKGKRFG